MERTPFCTGNVRFLGNLQRILLRAFFTTKSARIAKNGQKIHENSFVFFVSFLVKLFFGCGQKPRCVLIGALVLMLVVTGCKDKVQPGTAHIKRPAVSGVQTRVVGPTVVDEYYETSGTVKAKTISAVASRVMGTVTAHFLQPIENSCWKLGGSSAIPSKWVMFWSASPTANRSI